MSCRGAVRSRRLTCSLTALAAVVATVLAGCAQVPHEGPVVEVRERPRTATPAGQYNHPKGPQPGDAPADVVNGFLVAMTATPLETRTARAFLSTRAQGRWQPQRRLITYQGRTPARGGGQHVVVRLRGADQVGIGGQWEGRVPPSARRIVFPMVREKGEWRIAQAPDALIVPRTFYDQQYQAAQIYYFDPSGRILVPEPVHVQEGSQLASALVRALVRGPARSLSGVVRSFLPPGLSPVLSVPVSESGVAEVTLKGPDPGSLGPRTTRLILAQLSWTLRQDTSISSFRLTIAGHQIADSAGAQSFRVNTQGALAHDPAVSLASSLFYALRAGRLVSGRIDRPTPVDGPFGKHPYGIGPFAVSLDGNQVAGVTPSRLLLGPTNAGKGSAPATEVMSGAGLLRPSWDFARRLWEVQNLPTGAVVGYVRGDRFHAVRFPGISREDVRRFLVSRDGSRLVAVVRGSSTDRIVVSRVRYDDRGHPLSGTRARLIPWISGGTTRIRDIGWSTPATIAVLDQLSRRQAEARILDVDGSTAADETPSTTIPGRALGLVTSPVGGTTPYAVTAHGLFDLAQVDQRLPATATVQTGRLRHIAYAG